MLSVFTPGPVPADAGWALGRPAAGRRRSEGRAEGGGLAGRAAYGRGGLHQVVVWVGDLVAARASWGWLLGELGWLFGDDWGHGVAWGLGPVCLVVESGPDVATGRGERTRPGANHLALHVGTRAQVDAIVAEASAHGWEVAFAGRRPGAGRPEHYVAQLQDEQGFDVELVAD